MSEQGGPDRSAERILMSLALAENMGDVNDELPPLCRLLGFDPPTWSDELDRYVMPFEEADRGA